MTEQDVPSWMPANIPEALLAEVFRLNIVLPNGQSIPVDMRSAATVDYDRLEHELQTTPHQFSFVSVLYSECKSTVSLLERAIKARRGKIVDEVLERSKHENVKLAEKIVLAIAEKDDLLNKLEVRLIKAQRDAGKMWYFVQALQMKSENLRSLAGFKRQEMQQTR